MLASRMPRYAVGATVLGVLLSLSAGTVQALPAKPEPAKPPGVQDSPDPARGKNAKPEPRPVDEAAKAAVKKLDAAVLPERGVAEMAVAAKGAKPVRVGGLPVTVTEPAKAATEKATEAKATTAKAAKDDKPQARSAATPEKVRVEVLDQKRADKAGAGALLRVRPADGAKSAGKVRISVDYSAFEEAYGGSYGARLRLVELPACAAIRDLGSKNCSGRPKVLASVNDTDAETVTADVTLAAPATAEPVKTQATASAARQSEASTAGSTVLALQAGDSSDKGDYKATPLAPSASWNVSNSSGGFSWDYPLRTVPTPGGLTPSIGLGYSSQSADGRTSATNNQGSWLGDGFGYEPGYVERSYKSCAEDGHKTSAEQCWAFDNATIMLNGSAAQLIKDDKSGKWHFASESGARVEQLTGASNGDNNGEHWKVTTTEGTEYYFGLNRLPGWTSGKETTGSAWTTPVFGDDAGEPCYNSTFSAAHCKQAWRWNLDYVKDTHGNVMSYYYGAETNHYALNGKTDVNGTAYHRGGYLKRIDYGQRDGAVYDAKAPARVIFRTAERCLPTAGFDCAPSKMTKANAAHWPDTPVDRHCKTGTKCDASQSSATFWTTKRLTGITTRMRTGADTYADVDAWTLTHQFTDNGDDTKTLWLNKIDHEGKVGGSSKLPSLELQGAHLVNRVDSDDDNIDAFHRLRLVTVLSETGAQLDVTYAPTECTATALPKPGESTKRCYPVVWSPPGSIEPKTDWFHKYVVQEIRESDRTGGGDDLVTRYDHQGNAGWRHAEPDGITDAKYLTWGQWQGYGRTTVTSGNGEETATRVDYTYLQGLNGDKLPGGGTRTETVKDSTGTSYTGHKEYTGFEIESKTYDQPTGGKVIAKTISEPWKHDTATQTKSWATSKATVVQEKTSRGYELLSDGTWRETNSVSHYDTDSPNVRLARTEDFGDVATAEDDSCTRLWYADNPSKNIYELPSRSEAVAVGCSATPDRKTQVIADERTSYDGGAFDAAPTKGDATRTERLTKHDGTNATYQTTGTTTYDKFARPTAQTDADGAKTTTAYTDDNGLISQTKSTNALGHVTTTDYAPAWGQSSGQSDPNGKRTDFAHDPLGRLTKVWLPDRAKTTNPSIKYTYDVRRDKPVAVKTEKIENGATTYGTEYQLYDALLRPRQKQTEGPDGTRMVADVFYDGTGKPKKTNATYNATGAPSNELLLVANGEVGAQTVSEYDGLGRPTASIFQVAGVEQWRTTTTYDGERTHVNPPDGGTPTTAFTDAHGNTTELRHYNGPDTGPSTGYDSTKYTYDAVGRMQAVTDSKGNSWGFEYDQLGRRTKTVDPDAGATTTTYDGLDRPVVVTDARGEKTSTVYDKLSRPLTTWKGEPDTGTKLTETRYDKAGWLGHAYMSLRYTNGAEFFGSVVQSMDAFYQPLKTAYAVPKSEGALAGLYTFTTTYNTDGSVNGIGMPAAGGLTSESIAFGYDELQRPTSMTGKTSYVTGAVYSSTSQLKQLQLSTGTGRKTWQTFSHEKGTDRLTRSTTDVEGEVGQRAAVKRSHYSYDQAGNIQSLSDTAGAAPDVQCFDYDGRQRLTEAWTPAATEAQATGSGTVGSTLNGSEPQACSTAPGSAPLGGPAAYWTSHTVDAIGNRTKEVVHDTGLDASKDTTRTYIYGEGDAGPHAVTKVTERTPTGDRQSTYAYDATGNTTQRVLSGDTQTLDWNAEGKLTKTTEADGKETTYVYDAGGNRVIRRDATATTVYLPGMELSLAKGSSTVKATRYYSFAGETIAVRQNNGDMAFLASDHQGTSSLAINAVTGAVAQRRFDPYGGPRGTPSGTWPGEKGFVGGTLDKQSGLTHIGARQYDPGLGKFLSLDPLIDYTSPQQMNGYGYADNSPVTLSDPSGLAIPECMQGLIACQGGIPISSKKAQNEHEAKQAKHAEEQAHGKVAAAKSNLNTSKQQVKRSVKALIKIIKREIGVDAALDCFSSGDIGACGETLLNVAGSFAGGLAGKFLAKYANPFKWKKGYDLAKRVTGLVGDLIGGIKGWFKNSKALGKARDKLDEARAKTKAAVAKAKKSECHSFQPGTRVLLDDGTTKPIEDVALGDKVTVTDPETGKTTTREVVGTIVTEDDKHFVDLTIKTQNADASALISTTTHPFWVESENKWINAGDLKPGMTLHTPVGTTATVEHVRHFDQRQRTHDLTINDTHTYYVLAGATPVLVHNCGGGALDLDNLQDRADTLHALIPAGKANDRATTGVMHAVGGGPESLDVVAVGARKNISQIQRAQLLPHELGISRTGVDASGNFPHAEVKLWETAVHLDLTPTGLAVNRPFCPACRGFLQGKGATLVSDTQAIWTP
ncbi:polymorphic toxin-type HINT domain-containing protein [Streptomyces sp. SM11]|uniref:polymorphic toxin-type HINT domain-containing protein n=1 Tax=Streptomyces sp. SM11 TaxID=565557 RepID=UPI0027E48008|nr:polymorphic toxin-type HINT domain-containing protein [Streptomyces sp. SM11]